MEYWQKIKDIEPENLVFLDETGILLGLTRTHARSYPGKRVTELKPFYRAAKVTAIATAKAVAITQFSCLSDAMEAVLRTAA